ncbi:MAG TPA: serine hydrolase [Microbacterium sp.]|nr:serine hydrolase [Microbacterium sp.]
MAAAPSPNRDSAESPDSRAARAGATGARRGTGRRRRAGSVRPTFAATLTALNGLAEMGAQVAVCVQDLDRGDIVLSGDDYVTLPVGGLGVVPLLVEVASQVELGTLDPLEIIERPDPVEVGGVWQHLKAPALPVSDLAVLAASCGDAAATNALVARVGLDAVRARADRLGLKNTALLDVFRDRRGPDDAPQLALGSARELAGLFAALVNAQAVSAAVSAQVAEWLTLGHDLSLVGSATGLDPFSHVEDAHGMLFLNKTGREAGVRAEAGVLAGPRAGVAYTLIVCFDDLSIMHRLRAHDAFRTLGTELMEYVF